MVKEIMSDLKMIHEREEIINNHNILDEDEIKQIEVWTNKKYGEVLFDSNVDNWNLNTSTLQKKILNKQNLLFVIRDENNNKFGGFISIKIDGMNKWIRDNNSFVFSLKSNNRIKGMKKFNKNMDDNCSFWLSSTTYNGILFAFGSGHDICVYIKNLQNQSFCFPKSFDYLGERHLLCTNRPLGTSHFIPMHFRVIELHQ